MKTKLLLFSLIITFTMTGQQLYYTVPGSNGNNARINDVIKVGNSIYIATNNYSTTGTFPSYKAILGFDTTQSLPNAQEVYVANGASSIGIANFSNNQNVLRFTGSSGGSINYYDLNLSQSLPATPVLVPGISLNSIQNQAFYQNDFIYGNTIGNTTNLELFLPLQTLSLSSTSLWDAEVFGDTLYYISSDNTNLYAIDLTSATATPQIVHSDSDQMVALEITSNYIYYGTSQNPKLKRLDINTNTVSTLVNLPITGSSSVDALRSVEVIGTQVFYASLTNELYVITDSDLLSTNDFTKQNVSIYPNPSIDNIHIQINTDIKSFSIFSVLGKEIITGKFNASLDVSQLKAGIYFIKINSENGSVTKRFIKQ